jgi:PAS domain S-box-containing protein
MNSRYKLVSTSKVARQAHDAHRALRESEERYRAVVQQVAEAIFLLDPESMRLLEANNAFLRLLGYSEEELKRLTIYDLLPYEPSRVDLATHRALEQGEYQVSDRNYRRKDGSLVAVHVSITPISYGGRRVLCEVLRDITEQKRISDALAARVQQQAAVAELGQQALAGADLPTLLANTAILATTTLGVEFCKILELQPDGSSLLLSAGAGWREGWVGNTILSAGLDSHAGYTLVSDAPVIVEDMPNETRFHPPPILMEHNVISGMSVLIRGRDRPFGVIGVHTATRKEFTKDDINFLQSVANVLAAAIERGKVEEELQESRNQLEVILQGVADGITVQNPTGQIIYANSAALRMIGYSTQEELIQAPSNEILSRFDLVDEQNHPLSPIRLPGQYALRGEDLGELVVGWVVRETGEKHWSIVKAEPVKNEHGQIFLTVSIFRDVTERIERERRKDDFIALASHELKTPITSLKMFTQLLKRRFERAVNAQNGNHETLEVQQPPSLTSDLANDTLKQLSRMDDQLNKLTELVRDLLDTTQISAGKLPYHMEEFDLADLVSETVDDLQRIAERHTLEIRELVHERVFADRERIGQVLTNLITNAIKYSPKADLIIVGVEREPGAEELKVCVQDFGIGIPRSEQDKVFNRFFQVGPPGEDSAVRDTFPGLGLGLYISGEIVSRHGGRIWVDSTPGEGSTFYFTLPVDGDDRRQQLTNGIET